MFDQVPWFATRGAGAASLLLLTAAVVLAPAPWMLTIEAGCAAAVALAMASRILPRDTVAPRTLPHSITGV